MADRVRIAAVIGVVLLAAGCTARADTAVTDPTPTGTTGSGATTATSATSPGDAVRAAVDAVNSTAAGPVAAQRAVLERLVAPARAGEQAACAPATITVRLDPALDAMRPAPTGGTGEYRLPVLLEVYTGAIRTGTDLAGIDVTVTDGAATLAPLCLL